MRKLPAQFSRFSDPRWICVYMNESAIWNSIQLEDTDNDKWQSSRPVNDVEIAVVNEPCSQHMNQTEQQCTKNYSVINCSTRIHAFETKRPSSLQCL